MPLPPISQKFILHWGEMGTRWGVNRTVAQIHALLYLSPQPLHAEDIAQTLGVARSNVSSSLRELQGWGIVRIVHVMGDRRDHFESLHDVWEMFRVIMHERKKREIEPTLAIIQECLQSIPRAEQTTHVASRLTDMLDFFKTTTTVYDQLRRWPPAALLRLIKLGDKARRFLGLTST